MTTTTPLEKLASNYVGGEWLRADSLDTVEVTNPATSENAVAIADSEGNIRSQQNFYMNGAAIFHFAITVVPQTVNTILAKLRRLG